MKNQHRNLRSSGNQGQESESPSDDYVAPVNDWWLRLAGMLVLASLLILAVLALLPSVSSAREATMVTVSPRYAVPEPGVDGFAMFAPRRDEATEEGPTDTASLSRVGLELRPPRDMNATIDSRDGQTDILRTMTNSPGASTAERTATEVEIRGTRARLDALHASLAQGDGYILGIPMSKEVRIGSPNPQMTVHLEQARYIFDEGVPGSEVAFIARNPPGLSPPARTFNVLVESNALPGEAEPDTDYQPIARVISVEPDDFHHMEGAWIARKTVVLDIYSDDALEAEEAFSVSLRQAPDSSFGDRHLIQLRQPDGSTPCDSDGCRAEVTIRGGICDRTPEIQHAILRRLQSGVQPLYRGDCRGVSGKWLAKLTSLQLDFPSLRIDAMSPGDFAGLSGVTELHVSGQPQLETLPAGVFEGLSGLESLWIHHNPSLATLSEGVFIGLDRLRILGLQHNRLEDLEPGAFAGLASLETLVLRHNQLQSFPFDEFEALPALRNLFLSANPGYRWSIEVSDASLRITPGQPAAYRLRLTARPCTGGTEIAVRWHSLGWGMKFKSTVLRFTRHDWFRSREIQIETSVDTPPQARLVAHEARNGCYRQQMVDLPPTITVSVDSTSTRRPPGTPDEFRPVDDENSAVSLSVAPDQPAVNHTRSGISVLGGVWTLSGHGGAPISYVFFPTSAPWQIGSGEEHPVSEAPIAAKASAPDDTAPPRVPTAEATSANSIVNLRSTPRAWLTRIPRILAGAVMAVGRRVHEFRESRTTTVASPGGPPPPMNCDLDSRRSCVF